jgi:hypothetical protein
MSGVGFGLDSSMSCEYQYEQIHGLNLTLGKHMHLLS